MGDRTRHNGMKVRTLDDDVTVLAKGRALHGEGGRGPSAGLRSEEEREH